MQTDAQVLVIITPGFPKNEADSFCLPFAQNLVLAINRNFPEIKIIILSFQYPFTSTEYSWNGNRVIPLGGKDRGKLARRLIWIIAWQKLKRIKRENNIIGLLSFWCGECAFIGNRFSKKYGITHHCWILGQDAKEDNKFVQKANPLQKELIAVSDFIADEFFKNFLIRPQHIVPNGIDKNLFDSNTVERSIDIMGAGSLIPLKQYEILVHCIGELKKNLPHISAIIAGKGREYRVLQELIMRLDLEDNVKLAGEKEHGEVLKLMQQTKVFLHPSLYEGFSMVCQEALYAGCHVISFCKPMNVDFKHWHIVKTKDEMVTKALEILSQVGLDYNAVTTYSIDETAKSFMNLYID